MFIEGVEEKCIGQFKLIFSLLRMSEATKLQKLALEVSLLLHFICVTFLYILLVRIASI